MEGKLLELRNLLADQVIVFLNVFYFFRDLVLERASLQELLLFWRVENRKIRVAFRENVDVGLKLTIGQSALLHQQTRQKRVLG